MNQDMGASPDGDRAAGLRPQPPAESSQSSIPSAMALRYYAERDFGGEDAEGGCQWCAMMDGAALIDRLYETIARIVASSDPNMCSTWIAGATRVLAEARGEMEAM